MSRSYQTKKQSKKYTGRYFRTLLKYILFFKSLKKCEIIMKFSKNQVKILKYFMEFPRFWIQNHSQKKQYVTFILIDNCMYEDWKESFWPSRENTKIMKNCLHFST